MTFPRVPTIVASVLAGLTVLGCSGESTKPAPVATTLALVSGNGQTGAVGSVLSLPLTVKVTDQNGAAMAGISVAFAVTTGAGSLAAGSVATDAQGQAATMWTLGSSAGAQAATASVSGLSGSPVTFGATANPGAPTQVVKTAGDAQTGEAGAALGLSPSVTIRDALDNPVPGVTVTWTVTSGGGTVPSATSTSNSAGVATTAWTLGGRVGTDAHVLRAAISGGASATFSASAVLTAGALSISAGDNQAAAPGGTVAVAPAVLVKTPGGVPVAGVSVAWAVTAGGGSVAAATSTTDASGMASIGWTLGGTIGANNQGLSATAAGLTGSPASFVASVAGPAAQLAIASGDNQAAVAGLALPQPLAVKVTDAFNTPVSGVSVAWAVATGGGSVSAATVLTSADGTASVTRNLGPSAGPQTTTASVTGTTPASVTFNSTATAPASAYTITLRYLTPVSPARQAVFQAAADKWSSIIIGDVPDLAVNQPAGVICGSGYPAINETIDDVLIYVTLDSIDGPGMILGGAGPCARRSNTRFSLVGAMTFDTADVAALEASNIFTAVILHEMGHVLGIGTLWDAAGLPTFLIGPAAQGGTDPYFNGATAVAQFNANGGGVYAGTPVPVEAGGGPGTQDSHWRESVMGRELMTGYVSFTSNPLSSITVGSLADMGYTVSYANADPYTVNSANLQLGGGGQLRLLEKPPTWTLTSIDAQGRITSRR